MSQIAYGRHAATPESSGPPPSFGAAPPAAAPVPSVEQAESVAAWLRWHTAELAGVSVPLVLALAVSGWFVALVVPVAALWAINETRQIRTSGARAALTSPETTTGTTSEDN